jgi:type I restriction enzyme S subunit
MMHNIDMTPKEYKIVLEVLREHINIPCKVWAFGSRVKNKTKRNSDLDLAIECFRKIDVGLLADLEEAFREAPLPYKVDVVELHDVSTNFRNIINSHKVLLTIVGNIPALRFPEFEKSGEWDKKVLGDVCYITNGKANVQDHVSEGKYPLFDRSETIKSSDKYIFDCEAVIIPGEGMRFVPKYYKGKFNLHQRAYVLKDFHCNGHFVYHIVSSKSSLLSQNAVQSTVLSLRLPILQKFPVEFPKNPKEQQHIASCLSSLDELLALHQEKLQTLKEHKKGLMQNLFPQEGKQVPNYRFPEFEKSGGWEEKMLGDESHYVNGKAHEKDISSNGKYTVVNSKFISTEGEIAKYSNTAYCMAYIGDILMVLSDVPNGKAISKCFYVNENNKYSVNQRICRITSIAIDKQLLFYIMNKNPYFLTFDDGVKQTNLKKDNVLEFSFLVPKSLQEQQRIASCLSSVDELITSQSEKIEQLRQHKKGLMQGLFPKVGA